MKWIKDKRKDCPNYIIHQGIPYKLGYDYYSYCQTYSPCDWAGYITFGYHRLPDIPKDLIEFKPKLNREQIEVEETELDRIIVDKIQYTIHTEKETITTSININPHTDRISRILPDFLSEYTETETHNDYINTSIQHALQVLNLDKKIILPESLVTKITYELSERKAKQKITRYKFTD
jgi:hypothetical protein